jgi:hypothetical protein
VGVPLAVNSALLEPPKVAILVAKVVRMFFIYFDICVKKMSLTIRINPSNLVFLSWNISSYQQEFVIMMDSVCAQFPLVVLLAVMPALLELPIVAILVAKVVRVFFNSFLTSV